MAGEKRGITFEVAVLFAIRSGGARLSAHWNVKPSGMTIDPDITVGDDPEDPETIILVSRPASYLDSNRKFWRNIAELWEAKTTLTRVPRVISVQFGDGMKGDLLKLSHKCFDTFIHVDEDSDMAPLVGFVESLAEEMPPTQQDKIDFFRNAISAAKEPVREAFRLLTKTLVDSLAIENDFAKSIWKKERKRLQSSSGVNHTNRETHLRRGLAKLLLSTEPDLTMQAAVTGKTIKENAVYELFGISRKSIGGERIVDSEIIGVCREIDDEVLLQLITHFRSEENLSTIIAPLLDLPSVIQLVTHLTKVWGGLGEPTNLFRELKKCHQDPVAYCDGLGVSKCKYARPGAVAEMVHEIFRAAMGKRQAFGMSGLLIKLRHQQKAPSEKNRLEKLAASLGISDKRWRSATTVSYGYRDWMYGDLRNNFSLTEFELLRIADVLSSTIAKVSVSNIKSDAVVAEWSHNLFETKIASYREFRPLDVLLEHVMRRSRIRFKRVLYFPSIWHEKAKLDGESINKRSGTTTLYVTPKAIINTQSATSAGSSHKKKELMARAVSSRYHLDAGKVVDRGVKWILLIDGKFSDDEIASVLKAGWDRVFYPDEMDALTKAIL
jgi:hypothetical protein